MSEQEIKAVAELLVTRHGAGASLLAYQHVTRCMRDLNRDAAENWCLVLVEVEQLLNMA